MLTVVLLWVVLFALKVIVPLAISCERLIVAEAQPATPIEGTLSDAQIEVMLQVPSTLPPQGMLAPQLAPPPAPNPPAPLPAALVPAPLPPAPLPAALFPLPPPAEAPPLF